MAQRAIVLVRPRRVHKHGIYQIVGLWFTENQARRPSS